MQGDAITPAVSKGKGLVIGGEGVVTEAAEQSHHRQIELPVSPEARRIYEPVVPVHIHQPVSGPQVTMKARRSLGQSQQILQTHRDLSQSPYGVDRKGPSPLCDL